MAPAAESTFFLMMIHFYDFYGTPVPSGMQSYAILANVEVKTILGMQYGYNGPMSWL